MTRRRWEPGPAAAPERARAAAAIQRQPAQPDRPLPANPVIRRESIRFLLAQHHGLQGRQGPLQLSAGLRSELLRMLPRLTPELLEALWRPAPANADEALRRFAEAGHLPAFDQAPGGAQFGGVRDEPLPPGRAGTFSPFSAGMLGVHLRVNPQTPPPITATVRRLLSERGLPFSDRDLDELLAGRERGIDQIERILGRLTPMLGAPERRRLAATLADALLDAATQARLTREAPTGLERAEQSGKALEQRGSSPDLLRRLPVGVSITIHF